MIDFTAFSDELQKITKTAEYMVTSPANIDPEVGARHGTIGGGIGGGILGGYAGAGLGLIGRRPNPAAAVAGGLGGAALGAGLGALGGRAMGRWNAKLEGEKYKGNLAAKKRLMEELAREEKLKGRK